MHAARAIHKQREKREEKKLDVRRPSAASRRISRSPAVSVDTNRKSHSHADDESENLNFSYIGFIIAVFGAVPLVVGTFIEVPALWEIGLGVTLLGLFIGVVFWCTELCAEAKRFSQKKNQLSTRGKIEDSNLLHVPDRKFGNGVDSRRGSLSDSVSLISPAVQHYSPKHYSDHPQHHGRRTQSISQYSSDLSSSSSQANGHLIPPALLLRGNGRRDDGRVVSLVQPDPGLDDDSDSDAETVIEAPISQHLQGNTKVIQVQSCQGPHPPQYSLNKAILGTSFTIENEKISQLAQHHRTIRMPVMPQDLDKLQKCECGRYLLTERDKLGVIRLPGIIAGSNSGSTTTSNSPTSMPTSSLLPPPENSTVLNIEESGGGNDNNITCGSDVTTPLADQPPPPPPNKIISVTPSVKIGTPIPPTPQNTAYVKETIAQINPMLSTSTAKDFLAVASARKKTENLDDEFNDDDEFDGDGDVTPGNEFTKAFQETVVAVEGEEDKILSELLELTDVNDDEMEEKKPEQEHFVELIASDISPDSDENHNSELELDQIEVPEIEEMNKEQLQLSREGSRRRLHYQSQVTSINRPTSLPLPLSISTSTKVTEPSANLNLTAQSNNKTTEEILNDVLTTTTTSIQSHADDKPDQIRVQSGKLREANPNLTDDMSLDELLDSIEKNQEGEVLAVVVQ